MKKIIFVTFVLCIAVVCLQFRNEKMKEIAIWDFDGTIIKGDCSEGLDDSEKLSYKGLITESILAGLSNQYKGEDGVKKFFEEYNSLLKTGDKKAAYTYVTKIFVGTEQKKLEQFSENYFNEVMHSFYFSDSIKNMKELKEKGVENFVISASLEAFVVGASKTLGIPVDHIVGIKVKIDNGLMTDEVIEPVPFAEGKVAIMKEIEKKYKAKALYGFGNSYSTDGPFLYEISNQGGQSTMINGGKPCPTDQKNFVCTVQEEVLGF